MGEESAIEWTDATWNPWSGCTKVSPGCQNCYAERLTERWGNDFSVVRRASDKAFFAPLSYIRPRMIFTCSMSDFFHSRADEWRDNAWDVIRRTPRHVYQILTKRPERIVEHLPSDWGEGYENVWIGTSIEMQLYLGRTDVLRSVPAKHRFLSVEPLVGRVSFCFDPSTKTYLPEPTMLRGIDWVIVGGESDYANPRTMELEWARLVRDETKYAGIPFFLKQLGGKTKCECHNAWGCRVLDGRTYDENPSVSFTKIEEVGESQRRIV